MIVVAVEAVAYLADTIFELNRTRASSKLDDASFVDEASFDEDESAVVVEVAVPCYCHHVECSQLAAL